MSYWQTPLLAGDRCADSRDQSGFFFDTTRITALIACLNTIQLRVLLSRQLMFLRVPVDVRFRGIEQPLQIGRFPRGPMDGHWKESSDGT